MILFMANQRQDKLERKRVGCQGSGEAAVSMGAALGSVGSHPDCGGVGESSRTCTIRSAIPLSVTENKEPMLLPGQLSRRIEEP